MPAAIAIPLIVGAASSVAGAAISAHAAGKAADQQRDASNQALGFQRDIFQQQQAALNPYINLGTSAIGRYNQRYGGAPAGGVGTGLGFDAVGPVRPVAAYGPQTGPVVRVQAPTGEIAMLPQAQAQIAVSKGARILDSGAPNGPQQTHIPLGY